MFAHRIAHPLESSSTGFAWLFCAIVIAFVLAVYAPSFDNGFWHDDYILIQHAATATSLGDVLSEHWVAMPYNRPLWQLGLFLEYRAFGMHTGLYLVVNALLHAANAALLFVLLSPILGRRTAAVAALLFAAGVGFYGKAVVWVANLSELLCVPFVLATGIAAWRSMHARTVRGRLAWTWTMIATFLLGLASKESAVVAAPLAVGVALLARGPWRRTVAVAAPLAGVTVAYFAFQLATESGVAGYHYTVRIVPLLAWHAVELATFMLVPAQMGTALTGDTHAFVTRVATLATAARPWCAAAVAVAACVVLLAGSSRVRWEIITFAAFLVPFGFVEFPRDWLEIRYAYLPATFFCAIVATALTAVWRSGGRVRRVCVVLAALVAIGSAAGMTRLFEHKFDAMARNEESVQFQRELLDVLARAGAEPNDRTTPPPR